MRRSGFTLVEAVASMAIVTVAGSAMLMGIASTIDTTDMVLEQAQAEGIAQQLMDEIAGCRYSEPGSNGHGTLGPESGEVNAASRAAFDDLDDYSGLNVSPRDPWGIVIGSDDGAGSSRPAALQLPTTILQGWSERVEVYYADPSNFAAPLAAGQTSDYKVVSVSVYRQESGQPARRLVQVTRVFSYVP